MNKVALLSDRARNELFLETAAVMRTTPAIAEKDFWVVWTLYRLFSDASLNPILQFKGGTSLSKAFGVIGRFSEDIDLVLDWREVTRENPEAERSRNQQNKFNEEMNRQAKSYIAKKLLPQISKVLAPQCTCYMDNENAFAMVVRYPSLYRAGYLRPEILLEVGPLASWTPSGKFEISPYAATYFPGVFENPACRVPTILARRTFWEKATILHQEAHRALDKPMPLRYSRHYYDLALLAQSATKKEALDNIDLLAAVALFKERFYPASWANYHTARPGSLKLMPQPGRMNAIDDDYGKMQEMIFDKRLSLGEIMETLAELETEVNAVQWRPVWQP